MNSNRPNNDGPFLKNLLFELTKVHVSAYLYYIEINFSASIGLRSFDFEGPAVALQAIVVRV